MAFTVELTSGDITEFDDRARYSLDDSGALHITTPDRRLIYSMHAWVRVTEEPDPRQPSSRFV